MLICRAVVKVAKRARQKRVGIKQLSSCFFVAVLATAMNGPATGLAGPPDRRAQEAGCLEARRSTINRLSQRIRDQHLLPIFEFRSAAAEALRLHLSDAVAQARNLLYDLDLCC